MTIMQQIGLTLAVLGVAVYALWHCDPDDAEPAPRLDRLDEQFLVEHVAADGELLELAVMPGWSVGEVVDTLAEIDAL